MKQQAYPYSWLAETQRFCSAGFFSPPELKCGQAAYDKEINCSFSKLLSKKTSKTRGFPSLWAQWLDLGAARTVAGLVSLQTPGGVPSCPMESVPTDGTGSFHCQVLPSFGGKEGISGGKTYLFFFFTFVF